MRLQLVALLTLNFAAYCAAQTLTTLHAFTGLSTGDGAYPEGNLAIGPGGVLYGATTFGGVEGMRPSGGLGTFFSLTPPASPGGSWIESFLTLTYPKAGYAPRGGVFIGRGGVLYSTTYASGLCQGGSVLELNSPTTPAGSWAGQKLLDFCNDTPESSPQATPHAGRDSVLYGTAGNTVFSLTPPASPGGAWVQTILYSFTGGSDGGAPNELAIGADGAIYGTTVFAGVTGNCSAGCGTVYTLTPPATPGNSWTLRTLYSFTASGGDGGLPIAGVVIGRHGVLYGTTSFGGTGSTYCSVHEAAGCGTVFSLTPPASSGGAWSEHVLYRFTGGNDGSCPGTGPLAIGTDGVLYGATVNGGTTAAGAGLSCAGNTGSGTVFSLTPPASVSSAWTEKILHRFEVTGTEAYLPNGIVMGRDGILYGTTYAGGFDSFGCCGTVFSLTPQ